MMYTYTKKLQTLVSEFKKLPGIGERTAERLAYHILVTPSKEAMGLAYAIRDVKRSIRNCSQCNNITEDDPCEICRDTRRDHSLLCVVEQPRDLISLEKTQEYRGLYHVLMGRIAPLDGMGPQNLAIASLISRVKGNSIREVILATNPDMEGDATAFYIIDQLKPFKVNITQIARGIPSGTNIEYAGKGILTDALKGRHAV